jgi:hypothetical protein
MSVERLRKLGRHSHLLESVFLRVTKLRVND